MKKKYHKIVKLLSKEIIDGINNRTSDSYMTDVKSNDPGLSGSTDDICEYDKLVSDKFKKLFNNIINYPDNIRISFNKESISIEVSEISNIKKSGNNYGNKVIEGDFLSIYISKDKSFTITRGYNKVSKYTDVNMYDDLIDIVKEKVKDINFNNFNDIYNLVSKESGILRDSNLDDILN